MTIQASVDRTSLSLPALVIGTDPTSDFYFPEDGLTEPEFEERTAFAEESVFLGAALPTHSTPGVGSMALTVTVNGDTEADLKANKRALEAAFRQRLTYEVALTVVGAPDTYTCLPARVSFGTVSSGMTRALMARAVITVPCYPLVGA